MNFTHLGTHRGARAVTERKEASVVVLRVYLFNVAQRALRGWVGGCVAKGDYALWCMALLWLSDEELITNIR